MSASKVPRGLVVELLRERVPAVETVCPTSDDDDLIEPRVECFD